MSNPLNRQPGPRNEQAIELIREKKLAKYTPVYTSDSQHIGNALRIRHRTEDVNPDLKLYAAYLEVASLELGNNSFIPVDFISHIDSNVVLSVSLQTVNNETWNRAPSFIAGGHDRIEELS